MYRHGTPAKMGPPYPHDFPPPIDQQHLVRYGPIPQVPPRPTNFPPATQNSYHDPSRADPFSNPFSKGQNSYYNNDFGNPWGPMKGNSPQNPGRVTTKYSDMNWDILKRLAMNQQVEVNLSARGWVVGAVVSCLRFFQCISGQGYNIRYKTVEGEIIEQPFPAHPDCINPFVQQR